MWSVKIDNASIPFGKLMQIKSDVKSLVPILQPPCLLSLPCWHATSTIFSSLKCSFVWHRAPTWIRGYRCRGQQCFVLYTFLPPSPIFLNPRRRRPKKFYLFYPGGEKIFGPFFGPLFGPFFGTFFGSSDLDPRIKTTYGKNG